ncbi:hypothetical protein FJZ19_02075 [Candidatus Pacearchaeota archaeon]|nr:hypothetical protein [Candidatus Pacearchaeota archaeon]
MQNGILGDFDYPYIASRFERARKHKWIERYVSGISVSGIENLRALKGRHFVCFSSHRSHFDYIGLAYLFLQQLEIGDFPRFIAGKNLDSRILALLGLDFSRVGAFFVDRERIASSPREKKRKYLDKVDRLTIDALHQGQNFVDFFEGGRNYGNSFRAKTGFMRSLVDAANNMFIQINPHVICCGVDYDRVIEAEFFPFLNFAKRNFRALYYAADAAAFLYRPFSRTGRGSMHVSFSEPRRLSEIATSNLAGEQVLQLRDYVVQEVAGLSR